MITPPPDPDDDPRGAGGPPTVRTSGGAGFPEELAVASRNPGKIREILAICSTWPVRWVTAEDDPREWPVVAETGKSYVENAAQKARAVAAATGVPAMADDSGIEVDALGGEPGIHSARYAGEAASDERNLAKLLEAVRHVPDHRRTARYRCVALVAWPGRWFAYAEATCEGRIILTPRGAGGFGYDPAFVPTGEFRTMAELPPDEKDRISHRGRAFRALERALREGRRGVRSSRPT
ncbi:MAG: RdgB/HAM1 family non-canonical purine NTP pyrophosphatase [Actinomycetota bacterium]